MLYIYFIVLILFFIKKNYQYIKETYKHCLIIIITFKIFYFFCYIVLSIHKIYILNSIFLHHLCSIMSSFSQFYLCLLILIKLPLLPIFCPLRYNVIFFINISIFFSLSVVPDNLSFCLCSIVLTKSCHYDNLMLFCLFAVALLISYRFDYQFLFSLILINYSQ